MPEDSSLAADMDTLVMERHVKGWQGVFRTNPAFHLILAFFVGIVAGLGAIAFRRLIGLMHNAFFFGQIASRFDDLQHSAASFWGLGVVLVPVLIRPVVVLVKAIASSISIGSGGSVGREGPSIQIGAAFGSSLAQWLRLQEWQRLGLIAAGAGAGIAATFNTPVGGILFAIELMLVEVSARALVPVMIATGTAVTGAVMIFEMTSDYHIIIPLIIVASLAFGVRRLTTRETIYTRKLIRRGHFIPEARHSNLYLMRPAGEFIETPLIRVKGSRTLADIAVLLHRGREIPHILIVEGTQPRAVLTAPRVRELLRHRQTSTPIENFASADWFSVPVDYQIYDLVARFRATHQECALLCRIDPPEHHEDVIAIVTVEDVLAYTSLPMRLLRPYTAQ
ncbi:chloride channel protein [Acidithiobacillus ferriphilus]|uniref:chloride channel protein n=1 Tax=Acidithiobacillus ferriphilus TaxID=1689834 RepID=UPI001C062F10|nr:chloride channel protein [Acidithiobacillus ferriphilus]MBU2786295.1 chloride channel protein [Acidithiobacillus ferriphilus]UEP58747.1 chloride channel protein [Acidithiobacillus ferriphilus]